MQLGRTAVVAAMLATSTLVAPQRSSAAPMTGVTFVDVVRFVDTSDVAPGTYHFSLPTPPGATEALVNIGVAPAAPGSIGVVMVHHCGLAPDPSTDVVLPMEDVPTFVTNEIFAPISGGVLCVTTTVHTTRLFADLYGWVGSNGAAYVDTAFTHAATITGPVDGTVIDLSASGVPPNATGVAVWLDVLSTSAGFATLFRCDQPRPPAAQANWVANLPTRVLIAGVSTVGPQLCIYITDGAAVDVSVDGYYAPGVTATSTSPPQVRYHKERAPGFVGIPPTRLFDTRDSGIPMTGGQEYRFDLSTSVPSDTSAVVMNVTVTEPLASGFVSVYPCDRPRPLVSSLNYLPGQTVPNLVTVDAGSTLELCFFALSTTHLLADLAGFYRSGGGDGFTASSPVRMFDTRNTTKLAAGSVFEFDLTPYVAADASSAVFNLTATEVAGPGYVTAYPCGQAPPLASNLNVSLGQTVPNLVTVALPSNKHVCFFTVAATHLLADIAGWYGPSGASGFISITPTRWIDTREFLDEPLPTGHVEPLRFDLDFTGATAMVFNATVTEPGLAGFLTAFPCGAQLPTASNVNFVTGQTVPNMVIAAMATGDVCLFNSAPLHWIVDVGGFFTDLPVFFVYFPVGTDDT